LARKAKIFLADAKQKTIKNKISETKLNPESLVNVTSNDKSKILFPRHAISIYKRFIIFHFFHNKKQRK